LHNPHINTYVGDGLSDIAIVVKQSTTLNYLEIKGLDVLPGETLLGAAEVRVASSVGVLGLEEIKLANDASRAEIEVLVDNVKKLAISLADGSAVGVDVDRHGLSNTDSVRDLNEDTLAELGSDEGLGDPAGGVSSRTVNLGRVLAGESTTTVGTPTTIGINDDLAAGKTSIAVGTTDDEAARGVEVVDGILVKVLGGDDLLDDLLHELLADLLVGDGLVVLSGDDDGVDTLGDGDAIDVLVDDGDLSLTIGADPSAGAVLADLSEAGTELSSPEVSDGHKLLRLISGIAEHVTLITSANIVLRLVHVNTLSDIGGLLLDSNDDVAGLVVNTLLSIIIADLLESIADDLLVVDVGLGSDLTENHDHASLGAGLASNLGEGILSKDSIEDSIRDLISNLIRVTLVDTLRSEKEAILGKFVNTGHTVLT